VAINGKPAAIVTGAASGIGAATARLLAARGWRVQLIDRSEAEVRAVAKELADDEGSVLAAVADVSDKDAVFAAVSEAKRVFGRVDGLVNCAGIEGQASRLADITETDLDRLLAVNLKGVLFGMQAVVPIMIEQGGGSIVNIASAAAIVGIPRLAAYSATKGAVVAMSRAAAVELARKGVRVNAINPGVVRTKMFEESANFDRDKLAAAGGGAPIGRIGAPEEIAEAVYYLLSPASAYTTGTALSVDGGLSAQ
jgi:NAD(P)-dependent dehydrogenase (short-subunit alcohol dehydrogenase family)